MSTRKRDRDAIRNLHDDDLLSAGEVAQLFRVDPKTVARWAKDGKLPHVRTPGRHTRYHLGTMRTLLSPNQDHM